MIRRYRCLVAVACLTVFVVTLGLPWIGLSICGVGSEPVTTPTPAPAPTGRAADRSDRPDSAVHVRSLPPRAPPAA